MVNNIENNTSLDSVSELENNKNKLEMMRYRANGLSYMLGFIAILFSVFAAFISMNSMSVDKPWVLVKIAVNVLVLLVGFLCCEKAKAYSKSGSIILIVIGGVCVARMFWIPLQLMSGLTGGQTVKETIYATAWLPASTTLRGTLAIVLLACAAVSFISSGVIGYIRSNKLATYLESISKM